MENNETSAEKEKRLGELMKTLELTKSGYGGVMPNGNIVDRREHPEAVPFQENSLLGLPKPIKLDTDK